MGLRLFHLPKRAERSRGRIGWIVEELELSTRGGSWEIGYVTYKIEEIAVVGDSSRVKVLSVSGIDHRLRRRAWDVLNGTLYPTNEIKWESR